MISSSHRECEFFSILRGQGVELGLEGFDWVFFVGVVVGKVLIVVEVNQIGRSIVLVVWTTLWTVPGKMSYFSALEAGV